MKILIIQLADAAHVLLTTALLRCINKQMPEAELHVLVKHEEALLLAANPCIFKLHQLQFNQLTIVEELKGENFDHVFELEKNETANAIQQALTVSQAKQPQKGFKAFFQRLFSIRQTLHPADKYIAAVAPLGITNDGAGLDYFIPRAATVPYADLPASHLAGYIAFALTAPAQQPWTVALLKQVVTAINHPIVLLGEEKDKVLAENVRSVDNVKVYSACGKFSPYEMVDLVRKSKLLLAAHPYFVQTAAALKKELVWIDAARPDEAEPYYGQRFLKSNPAAYNRVEAPAVLFQIEKAQATDAAYNNAANKFVTAVAAGVKEQLKASVKTQTQ